MSTEARREAYIERERNQRKRPIWGLENEEPVKVNSMLRRYFDLKISK